MVAFVPMRLSIYHSVGASEPIFICEICFALICYKYNKYSALLWSIWAACITRIEGMAVGAVFGICYLLRLDILHAIMMFLTFVAPVLLMAFHYSMFDDFFAYISFNQGHQRLVSWPPLPEMRSWAMEQSNTNYAHGFFEFYGFYLLQALLVLPVAGPIGILCGIWVAYIGMLSHMDIYRFALPAGVFGTVIGLDILLSHKIGRWGAICALPVYYVILIGYCAGQINSNRCGEYFLKQVLTALDEPIH
jgi:hypothetical protein